MSSEKIIVGSNVDLQKKNAEMASQAANFGINEDFLREENSFITEEVELPSKGVFYKNGKKTVKIKYLTSDEDNILYSPELIKSGKVLDALLQQAVVDKDLNPSEMLIGDRNVVLVQMAKNGIGEIYNPGEVIRCPHCKEVIAPDVDLNKLKLKYLAVEPDEKGEYNFLLPFMNIPIKFRMLTGYDENRLSKPNMKKASKDAFKVSTNVTDKYKLQIMEVGGQRDKLYVDKLVKIMPMRDSNAFREYVKLITPGMDYDYDFVCTECESHFTAEVPLTARLFYPNVEL